MDLLLEMSVRRRVGIVLDVKHISTNDRLLKKKYIGEWRARSYTMQVRRVTFPMRVTRYITKTKNSRYILVWGKSENPRRTNWRAEIFVSVISRAKGEVKDRNVILGKTI